MKSVVISYTSLVWLGLVTLTAVSWILGERSHLASASPETITHMGIAMIVVAFIKVRFVGLHFMELGHAPWPLRLLFEAWVVVVCIILLVLYIQ
jgi:hypothetical protein